MAKINFPNNRDQLVPPLPTGALQDGDTTNITADGVTITYVYKKPGAPNTDSWWKSMGRVNNATPIDKIEEGDSSVEVIDTGTNGQVVVTTDGTARAKFRTDGSFVVGGNLDTDPAIQLFDNGNGIFQEDVRSYRWDGTDNVRAYLGANSTSGTGAASMNARKGLLIYETSGPTRVAEIDIDGNAAFASGKVRVDKSGTLRVSTDVSSSGAGGVFDIIPGNSGTDGVTLRTLAWEAGALNQGPLKFNLGAPQVERVRFNTDGDVEIGGTIGTSPNIKLNGSDGSASFAGKITLAGTSPAGIQFGSTDSGGDITSQTLDDYEEGTWTPTINSVSNNASVTVTLGSVSSNFYTKIGNKVLVTCRLPLTSSDNSAQVAVGDRITILPSSLPFPILGRGVTGTLMTNLDNPAPVRAAIFTAGDNQLSFVCVYKQGSISYASNYELTISYLANT